MNKIIPIRVTEEEYGLFKQLADKECRSVSSLLRYSTLQRARELTGDN